MDDEATTARRSPSDQSIRAIEDICVLVTGEVESLGHSGTATLGQRSTFSPSGHLLQLFPPALTGPAGSTRLNAGRLPVPRTPTASPRGAGAFLMPDRALLADQRRTPRGKTDR